MICENKYISTDVLNKVMTVQQIKLHFSLLHNTSSCTIYKTTLYQ